MRTKTLLRLLLAACTFFVFQNLKAQTETEPNNTKTTANTVALNASGSGHISPAGDVDWWKVTTTSDGKLDVTLTDYSNDYTNFYLYDNDGTTLLKSGTSGSHTSATFSTDGLAAGTYYIEFTGYNTAIDTSTYSFTNTLTPAPVANDQEPDSTRALALTLPLNGGVTGHVGYYYNNHRDSSDWYKVTTTSDGLLRLTITTEPSTLNAYINCYLYDNNGTIVLNSNTTGSNNTTTLSTDGLAAGTYYVKMSQYNINDYVSYKLADSLFTAPVASDKEPNGSKATADSLPVNSMVTGHVGYYYNNLRDTADWYKLTTNTDGDIHLTITTEPSSLNAYINYYVFDNDGTTVLSSNTIGGNNTSSFNVDGLAKGTYYVRMSQYNQNDYVSYKLQDSIFKYQYAADSSYEPNAYAAQAKTILSNRRTQGHFGFYYNHVRDTTDWFKINYTGTGNLSFVLNHLPHISDGSNDYVNFYVFKDTAATALYSNTFGSETMDAVNLTGLSEGYYYIKITQYNNNDFEAYSLLDSFTQVNIAKISVNAGKTLLSGACGMDSITYNLSASHSPYSVRLYKNNALYDSAVTVNSTVTFKNLSAGSYYATSYGDGATDSAYGKSETSVVTPPVPTGLATTGIGVHTATLNWTKLSCANYYKVQYRVVGAQAWTVVNTVGDTSKLALTGLLPYTSYVWEVASVDTAKGSTFTSAYSDSLIFKTLSDTAHIALIYKGVGQGCNNDTLRYKATNSAAPYTVTLYRNGIVYGSPMSVTDTASFYNVAPGNYYATATGMGSGGSYGISDTTQIVPPAPTNLITTNITATTANLHWNGVTCSNYYTVEYRVTGSATWISANTTNDSLALITLIPSTMYTFRVEASDSANKQTVTGIYSDTATFTTLSVLPVTFVSFNAILQNSSAVLSWATVNEINDKGYEVQKSTDGNNFFDLAFVTGKGNSATINNYAYTDLKVTSGNNYYRLKQIDFDGKFTYSSTIKIDYSKFEWTVSGNPASGNTWLQLQLDKSSKISIQVLSINGSLNQSVDKGNLLPGTYSIPLNLNNLSSGIYIIRLMADNNVYTKKIIR